MKNAPIKSGLIHYFNHKNASININSIPANIQIIIGSIARKAPRVSARRSFFVKATLFAFFLYKFGSYQLKPSTFISANVVSVSRLSIFLRFSLRFIALPFSYFFDFLVFFFWLFSSSASKAAISSAGVYKWHAQKCPASTSRY